MAVRTSEQKNTLSAAKKAASKKTNSAASSRKKAGKAAAQSKRTQKKSLRKQSAAEKKLSAELIKILPLLDEEGLDFLLEQARVLLYNMQVDNLNAENELLLAEHEQSHAEHQGVQILRGAGSQNYHIVCNGKYSIFNEDEMLDIIRICHADDDMIEIKSRLFHWFFQERSDFLSTNGIQIESPELTLLIELVRKQFKLVLPQ